MAELFVISVSNGSVVFSYKPQIMLLQVELELQGVELKLVDLV